MDYDRIASYLRSLEPERPALIDDIEAYAAEHDLPIARSETVSFLQTIIDISAPERILEVGTCIGYSAIIMAGQAPRAHITTIEIGEADYRMALANINAAVDAGLVGDGQINAIFGDAGDILPGLSGPFDFIFMDAAKGQYLPWLPQVLRLLDKGGVLVSDNVLQGGTVMESRFSVERRERTIHKRMRQYLYELKHRDNLSTSVIPIGDGVALTYKKD